MIAFEANVYRVVSAQYDPLDPTGAALRGGRCNPRGLLALYFATTVPGALSESLMASDLFAVAPFRTRLLVCVHARLSRVLDLRDDAALEVVGLGRATLLEPWLGRSEPTPLQNACASLSQLGVQGIVYPSELRDDSANLVVFVGNLGEDDALQVVGGE